MAVERRALHAWGEYFRVYGANATPLIGTVCELKEGKKVGFFLPWLCRMLPRDAYRATRTAERADVGLQRQVSWEGEAIEGVREG